MEDPGSSVTSSRSPSRAQTSGRRWPQLKASRPSWPCQIWSVRRTTCLPCRLKMMWAEARSRWPPKLWGWRNQSVSSTSLHVAVLGSGSGEPRVHDLKREVELGSHRQLDCLLLQVLTAGLLDSVFVMVPYSCWKSKLRSTQVTLN